jgi:hypothetical protein
MVVADVQEERAELTYGRVGVAFVGGRVAVRDSRGLRGPVLACTPLEWAAFLGGVLDGESNLAWRDHTNASVAGHPGPRPGGRSGAAVGAPDALLRAGCLVAEQERQQDEAPPSGHVEDLVQV